FRPAFPSVHAVDPPADRLRDSGIAQRARPSFAGCAVREIPKLNRSSERKRSTLVCARIAGIQRNLRQLESLTECEGREPTHWFQFPCSGADGFIWTLLFSGANNFCSEIVSTAGNKRVKLSALLFSSIHCGVCAGNCRKPGRVAGEAGIVAQSTD